MIDTPCWAYGPSTPGWNFVGPAGITEQNSPGFAPWFSATTPDGSQAAFIQNNGSISQDILDFIPGQFYYLTVWLVQRPNEGLNPVGITLTDDSNPSTVLNLGTATPTTSSSFTEFTSEVFEPTNTHMTLQLAGLAMIGDDDTALDLVNISSAPEPGTIFLIGAALAIGASIRRRRSRF
jgi:hypothetical protein